MNDLAELETPFDRERDQPYASMIDTIRGLSDDQVGGLILAAQRELKMRFDMRIQSAEERQAEERKALTLERQELAHLGVTFEDTNGHKKGRRKVK